MNIGSRIFLSFMLLRGFADLLIGSWIVFNAGAEGLSSFAFSALLGSLSILLVVAVHLRKVTAAPFEILLLFAIDRGLIALIVAFLTIGDEASRTGVASLIAVAPLVLGAWSALERRRAYRENKVFPWSPFISVFDAASRSRRFLLLYTLGFIIISLWASPFQLLMIHFWIILAILIFSYFVVPKVLVVLPTAMIALNWLLLGHSTANGLVDMVGIVFVVEILLL